ncbi:MAG: hypothetical protein HN474_07430 [Nitrospina sp.]|jgi:pyruvate kinase|nr:hypothetical protein [Nitrospina sp.]
MSIKILATLAPASLDEETVTKIAEKGVGLFRINLSHTPINEVRDIIKNSKLDGCSCMS